jgi:hypothetical protein
MPRCPRVGGGLGDEHFDRGDEAIAHTGHGLDVLLAGRPLPERLPQHRYVVVEVVLLDGRLGPDGVQQLLLRDEPPGVLDQHAQRIEDLQPQRDRLGPAGEETLPDVELERLEPIRASGSRVAHDAHLRKATDARRSRRTPAVPRF